MEEWIQERRGRAEFRDREIEDFVRQVYQALEVHKAFCVSKEVPELLGYNGVPSC